MGFFFQESVIAKKQGSRKDTIPLEHLKNLKCTVCPLGAAKTSDVKVKPIGSEDPLIYILGESPPPGWEEESPFSDKTGQVLLKKFPPGWYPKKIRVGHVTQCATLNLENPVKAKRALQIKTSVECCRSFAENDIEQYKPKVVIGLGYGALMWMTKQHNIDAWAGRMIPMKIGTHAFWFLPLFSPEYVRSKRNASEDGNEYHSETDGVFEEHIQEIVRQIEGDLLPEPILDEEDPMKGVVCITGKQQGDFDKLIKFLARLEKEEEIATDVETTDLRPYHKHSQILTMSFSTETESLALAWDHPEAGWTPKQKKELQDVVRNFLINSGKKWAHNLNMEQEWFGHFFGMDVLDKTEWGDTMGQAYLLDSRKGVLNLDALCLINFGIFLKALSNINTTKCIEYSLKELLPYNALDAKYCLRLARKQAVALKKEKIAIEPYVRSIRTVKALVKIQHEGILLDMDRVQYFSDKLTDDIETIKTEIRNTPEVKKYKDRFGTFNFTPANVKTLITGVLKMPLPKNKKGKESVDEECLSTIVSDEIPSLGKILTLRGVSKLKSTYVDSMFDLVYDDVRLHTHAGNFFSDTGRVNTSDPNTQNFPKRDPDQKKVRQIIVPPAGHAILASDYGQIEARVIGILSKDEKFCESLWTGYDIHMEWAIEAAKLEPMLVGGKAGLDDPTKMKKLRGDIKNQFVFPSFFGSSGNSVSINLGISKEKGNKLQEKFWKVFSQARAWQQSLKKYYEKHGYVVTATGRRFRGPLSFPKICNSPIQGTAADMMLETMCTLSEADYKIIMTIHDDITSYIPLDTLETDIEKIAKIMCTPEFDWVNVPLSIEMEVGLTNWEAMQSIGTFTSTDYDYPTKARSFARPKGM